MIDIISRVGQSLFIPHISHVCLETVDTPVPVPVWCFAGGAFVPLLYHFASRLHDT